MNKEIIAAVFLIFCLLGNVSAQEINSDKETRAELLGVWQASPSVGSGMDDNFQFFADGKFRFNYNQMDGLKRIYSYSGKWKIKKGRLVLKIKRIEFVLGGEWIKSSGSIATEYEIEGGKIYRKVIKPIEIQNLETTKFVREEYQNTTKIDGIKYWKLSSDPETYKTEIQS